MSDRPGGPLGDDDRWTMAKQAHYARGDGTELTTVLVTAIAEARGVDPLDHAQMPPLYEFVDTSALEQTFFGPAASSADRTEDRTTPFPYQEMKVGVRSDGWIFVYEPAEAA